MRLEMILKAYEFYQDPENFPELDEQHRNFYFVHYWLLPQRKFLIFLLTHVDEKLNPLEEKFAKLCADTDELEKLISNYETYCKNIDEKNRKNKDEESEKKEKDAALLREFVINLTKFDSSVKPLVSTFLEKTHSVVQSLEQPTLSLSNGDNLLHAAVCAGDWMLFQEIVTHEEKYRKKYGETESFGDRPNNLGITPKMLARHSTWRIIREQGQKNSDSIEPIEIDLNKYKENENVLLILLQEYLSIQGKTEITSSDGNDQFLLSAEGEEKCYRLMSGQHIKRRWSSILGIYNYDLYSHSDRPYSSQLPLAKLIIVPDDQGKKQIKTVQIIDLEKIEENKKLLLDIIEKYLSDGNENYINQAQVLKIDENYYSLKSGQEIIRYAALEGKERKTRKYSYRILLNQPDQVLYNSKEDGCRVEVSNYKVFVEDNTLQIITDEEKEERAFKFIKKGTSIIRTVPTRESAEREANNLSKVSRPENKNTQAVTIDEHHYAIKMRRVYGNKLSDLLLRKKKNLYDKYQIALNIAQELKKIHAKDILHLDLRDDQIMVDENNTVKIFDFGSGREICSAQGTDRVQEKDRRVQEEELKGVMYVEGFAPPELMFPDTERYADKQSDLYSFGVLLLFLLVNSEKYKDIRNIIKTVRETINSDRSKFTEARSDKETFKQFYGKLIEPLTNLKPDYFESWSLATYQTYIIPLLSMNAKERPNITQCIRHLNAIVKDLKPQIDIAKNIIYRRYNNILQNLHNKCQLSEKSNVVNSYEIILLLTELGEILRTYPTIAKELVDEYNIKDKIKHRPIFSLLNTVITELKKENPTDQNLKLMDIALKDLGVDRTGISDSLQSTSTAFEGFNEFSSKIKKFICNDLIPNSKFRNKINQKIEEFELSGMKNSKGEQIPNTETETHQLAENLRSSTRNFFANPDKTDPEKFPELKQHLLKETADHIKSAEELFLHRKETLEIASDILKLISSIPLLGAPLLISHYVAKIRTGKARCFSSNFIAGLFGCNAQRTLGAHGSFKEIEEEIEEDVESMQPPPSEPTPVA